MHQNDNLNPADFIAQRRQDLGMTQAELASRIAGGEMTSSFITMMEKRRSGVPLRRCGDIAAALEADPLQFVMLVLRAQMPEIAAIISKAIGTPGPR